MTWRFAPPAFLLLLLLASPLSAQQLFTTARTEGFGSPSLLVGFSVTRIDQEQGEDFTLLTARASVGIGRKTDVFGSFDGVLGGDILDTKFPAFTLGVKHQFIRTGFIEIGSMARVRGNRTSQDRFEDALLDFAGIVSFSAGLIHPYYALMYTRPFGFSLDRSFQRTTILGVEVPVGDIPRVLGEVSLGDRRSFGLALKLAF